MHVATCRVVTRVAQSLAVQMNAGIWSGAQHVTRLLVPPMHVATCSVASLVSRLFATEDVATHLIVKNVARSLATLRNAVIWRLVAIVSKARVILINVVTC